MKLLNGYILVRVDEEKQKTNSGLFLPSGATKLPNAGVIEAIADGVKDVKVGDKVQFLRYAAIDGVEEGTRLCTIDHIVAVING